MITPPVQPSLEAGFWRRIVVHPAAGQIVAALEDDVHRFLLRLTHQRGVITGVQTRAERFPWSSCPDAGEFLTQQLVGRRLDSLHEEEARSHCTHLLDLTGVAAAHAMRDSTVRFDMRVNDRRDQRASAFLFENDELVIRWDLAGLDIVGPDDWAGRDLRQLSRWQRTLPAELALKAAMLRRAILVSGVRRQTATGPEHAADQGPQRMGACFTYQMPRALQATNTRQARIDFSHCKAPLAGFRPDSILFSEE